MTKKVSFSCWTKAEKLERQDGHIFQAQEANRFTGFASYCRLTESAMLIILNIAWVPCGCQSNPDFSCVINFSTQNIKRCRKSSKVFHVLTPPGNFINLWLTVPAEIFKEWYASNISKPRYFNYDLKQRNLWHIEGCRPCLFISTCYKAGKYKIKILWLLDKIFRSCALAPKIPALFGENNPV